MFTLMVILYVYDCANVNSFSTKCPAFRGIMQCLCKPIIPANKGDVRVLISCRWRLHKLNALLQRLHGLVMGL